MSATFELDEDQLRLRDWARDFVDTEVRGATVDGVQVWRHYDES